MLWGTFFAVVLLMEKFILKDILSKAGGLVSRIYTCILLLISFAIFALEDLGHLGEYLQIMLGKGVFIDDAFLYFIGSYGFLFLILFLCATPWPYSIYEKVIHGIKVPHKIFGNAILILLFVLSVAYIVDGTYNPFLYFRF